MSANPSTLTPEQLEARKLGIGGSDVAAVAGISPWKSRLEVYREKVGEAEPEDESFDDALAKTLGVLLEDAVATLYEMKTGLKLHRVLQTRIHPEIPILRANLDRRVVGANKGAEIKTVGFNMEPEWGDEGTDEIPIYYAAQIQHYMGVTGLPSFDVPVLFLGSRRFKIFEVERDEDIIDALQEQARDFWGNYVLPRIPPEPRTLADVLALYPAHKDPESYVVAGEDMIATLRDLVGAKAAAKAAKALADAAKVKVQAFMGDNALIRDPGTQEILCTWRSNEVTRIESKRLRDEEPETAKRFSKTTTERKLLPKAKVIAAAGGA